MQWGRRKRQSFDPERFDLEAANSRLRKRVVIPLQVGRRPEYRDPKANRSQMQTPEGAIEPTSAHAHGFFSALIAGPMVMPSAWLPHFMASTPENAGAVKASAGRVLMAYNDVADLLQKRSANFADSLLAFARADERGDTLCEWYRGFFEAMNLRGQEWLTLEDDPQTHDLVAPLSAMAEITGDSSRRNDLLDLRLRESLGLALGHMTVQMAEIFRKRLVAQMQQIGQPARREEPKVSRNEPCPCGSGKKYKRCCGSTLRAV